MTIYSKPDYSTGVWASQGNIVQPSSDKIEQGNVVEKPKYEVFNYLDNRQDQAIAYLLQYGIPEWDYKTEYPVNAYIKYSGILYRAKSQNIDKNPATQTGIWEKPFPDKIDYDALAAIVNRIINEDGFLPYYVSSVKPIMTGKAIGVGYSANVGLLVTGDEPVGYNFNTKKKDGFVHTGDYPAIEVDGEVVAAFNPNASKTQGSKAVVTMDTLLELLQIKIGDLYFSTLPENPATRLGYGTWDKYAQGKALVGQSADVTSNTPDWCKTGGTTFGEYDHKLTNQEIPKHKHETQLGDAITSGETTTISSGGGLINLYDSQSMKDSGGGDQPHNNVQPSIVVYIWKRTG